MRRLAALACAVGAVSLVAACGGEDAATPLTLDSGTIGGVGSLPEVLTVKQAQTSTSTSSTLPRPTIADSADFETIGEAVDGNRVLMIGDSILASTSRRYGGEMCFALQPLGWAVEINAEVGRFIEFGTSVLDRRLRPEAGIDWDAAVVFLGNNYRGDVDAYRSELFSILDRLEPRPTVLVTVTEFRPDRARVNDVIRDMVQFYPAVRVVDWAEITAADPSLLSGDGLHLSDAGRVRLALEMVEIFDEAPPESQAACLSTSFTDDSAVTGPGVVAPPSTTRSAPRRPTTTRPTTTRPSTARPANTQPNTTAPRGSGGTPTTSTPRPAPTTSEAPDTAVADTTTTAVVDPTAAPSTAAPTTAAPTTAAPETTAAASGDSL
jgi:hypothetical protein